MKLAKEKKEKKLTAALSEEEALKYGKGAFAIIGFYRVRIAILLLFAGYIIFSLQTFSSSDGARPDKVLGWLVFQDIKAADAALKDLEEKEKKTGKEEVVSRSELPPTDGHYRGKPAADFQERFDTLVAEFEYPEEIISIPVNLTQLKEDRIVPAGSVPPTVTPDNAGSYFLLRMTPDNAKLFLRYHLDSEEELAGRFFMGPFPYTAHEADGMEIALEDNSEIRWFFCLARPQRCRVW